MARFGRRSFLTGFFGVLAVWLGNKATPAPAQPSIPQPPIVPSSIAPTSSDYLLANPTTFVYDSSGRCYCTYEGGTGFSTGNTYTYTYDVIGVRRAGDPPPADPPGQEPPVKGL
jgi:hypothetical protein